MDQGNDSTPNLYYAGCAFTYSVAMVASNKALQWVRLNFNYFLSRHIIMCENQPKILFIGCKSEEYTSV